MKIYKTLRTCQLVFPSVIEYMKDDVKWAYVLQKANTEPASINNQCENPVDQFMYKYDT